MVGWIRKKKNFLLFKNRDSKREHLKTNVFVKDDTMACVIYTNRKGCWAGVNKYGIGFVSAKGPYRIIPKNHSSWKRFNEIGETVLKQANTLIEAKELFLKIYKNHKIGESANVLLCDKNRAYLLELCLDKIDTKLYSDHVFKTNHFELLDSLNSAFKEAQLETSKVRLKKFEELFEKSDIEQGKDLISLLTHHSERKNENICRHESIIMTVGSVVFDSSDRKTCAYYNINKSPCGGIFKKEIISFAT